MPIFRADFDVFGDLVLPLGVEEISIKNTTECVINFRNGDIDSEGYTSGLIAVVIGQSSSIDEAEVLLQNLLANQLDLLSFVTHARFRIVQLRRLIDWEEYQITRNIRIFSEKDSRYPPEPGLFNSVLDSVKELDLCPSPPFTLTALDYFRQGVLEKLLNDQFLRFWLALEIIAENCKEKLKVPILCQVCKSPMRCEQCGLEQKRVPMATDAIKALIESVMGEGAAEVSKRQLITRNSLMHGRNAESIKAECGTELSEIVEELAYITWHAIMFTIPLKAEGPDLEIGSVHGSIASSQRAFRMLSTFEHKSNERHPAEDQIPNHKLRVETTFEGLNKIISIYENYGQSRCS